MRFTTTALLAAAATLVSAVPAPQVTVDPQPTPSTPPRPTYQVTDFVAQHNKASHDETISFTIASENTGLAPTDCFATYTCQHTDYLLCDLPVRGECTDVLHVNFGFSKDLKSKKWELSVGYQAESVLYSSAHEFPYYQDSFYAAKNEEGIESLYEQIKVPGGSFEFTG